MYELRAYVCKKCAIRVLEKLGSIVYSNVAIPEFQQIRIWLVF